MEKTQSRRLKKSAAVLLKIIWLAAGLLLVSAVSAGAAGGRDGEVPAASGGAETEQILHQEPAGVPASAEPQMEQQSTLPAADIRTEEPPQGPVDSSYFEDAVFLGDSRTEGFQLYSGLKTGQYLHAVGATVESVFTKATEETEEGKVPILDALDAMDFSKVYIMLGVNELGWPRKEDFHDQYGKIVDRIRELHPEAKIVLQSILPVSARQEAKGSYVNNERIAVYNQLIVQLAEEKDCTYLNVAEAVTGTDGCLLAEETSDGVHLNVSGCQKWLEYLEEHPV